MNNKQKEVEKQLLEDEKQILEQLKENYSKALVDVKERIKNLTLSEMTQSKIYQKQYQENLEKQLQSIVDLLSADNVQNINNYLIKTYQDGFIGTLYNMQSEGVPFVMPINQETVLKSISKKTEDFQLSKTLYQNADELKKTLKSEITRGISQGYSYNEISKKITLNSEADLKKSYRIARTEGGRVQTEAKFECMKRAKANGADVVKEWDSTMDHRTRESHVMLDGQIKELDEPFEVNGYTAMYPHNFGIASEDINCRCILLERARWAVEDNNSFTKNVDGDIVEFQNVKDYKDYKEKYFNFYQKDDKISKIEEEVKKEVQYIGKLDKRKLGKYAEIVTTDEVVLTDERKHHIYEGHSQDYETIIANIERIVLNPNEVLEDNKNKDTIMLIDKLEKNNLNVIVKLNTNNSQKHTKNSIMTAWIIRDRNLKKLREKNKTIYKKE
ncbi:MAG: hypothetical protein HFJ48_03780 [Clostridia bacterium]|nr:hypothetical protein [Clostridia bacterium]